MRIIWIIFISPQFYSNTFQTLLNRSYNYLAWALTSPPKPHAFVSLSLQSKISIRSFTKHLTLANILTGITIFIIFFLLRTYVFPEVYYLTKVTFLDYISVEFYVNKDLFLGIWAIISRFSLKGFIEDILEAFLPRKLYIADGSLPLSMNQDQELGVQGGSSQASGINIREQMVIDGIFTDTIRLEFDKFKGDMAKIAESLKKRHIMFDQGKVTMDDPEATKILVMMLQDQTQFLNASILKRIDWVHVTRPSLPSYVKAELSTIEKDINRLHGDHIKNIDKIINIKDEQQQVKEYFDLLNAYRNKVRKEIIKLETVSHDGFRKNEPHLYKLKEFKQLVNKDAPKAIKEVVDQDGYLKSKLSEIINAKKK